MRRNALDKMSSAGQRTSPGGYGRYAGLGLSYAATIGVFAWLGWYLDERLGSRPWFLIGGVLVGFVGGTISLVRKVPPARGGAAQSPDP